MGTDADTPELHPRELADLSALADGTIDSARREEVRARIAASPQLTALYARERRVVALLHVVRATERAPAGLRTRIEVLEGARPARKQRAWTRTRWHLNMGGRFAGMAAAAVIVLALLLIAPGGTPGAPSVSQAAALATQHWAPNSAPAPDPSNPAARLTANVQDVYFPNWGKSEGWKAGGQRINRLNGRPAMTVYYGNGTAWIAYTIVAAPALKAPAATSTTYSGGVEYRTLKLGGRPVVTWENHDHQTCVLSPASGTSVLPKTLLHLAANS
jgi:anti-sigma factor RsiW